MPRGIRNNNPGNIRVGSKWKGRAMPDEISHAETDFVVFRRPEWGIRALVRVLITYQVRHGLRTVRQMLRRWAPGHENPHQDNYIAYVSGELGVDPDEEIDVKKYKTAAALVAAITQFENGEQPYSQELIDFGLHLAGVRLPLNFLEV